jgi:HlyD family secretion protein
MADLITQSNSLALTCAKLENDKEQLEKSKIFAPQDGLVVYATMQSRFSSQSMIEEGAMIRERQELIKLPDTSQMKVSIKVHESHVNKIRPGQAAFVVLDNMPDKRFKGAVSKVAVLPDTQSMFGNPNLKVYKTEVVITDNLPDVKPGVSARAEIVITNIPQALTVPLQAVTTHKGKIVVFTKKGGDSEPVPVEVGLFNTKFIEITSGLKEGDEVLLSPPYDVSEKDLGGAIIGEEDQIPEPRPDLINRIPDNGAEPGEPRPPRSDGPRDRGSFPGENGERPGRAGPGQGSSERKGSGERQGFNREEMLQRFDKNGDGQLDDAERAAMMETFGGRGRKNRPAENRPE